MITKKAMQTEKLNIESKEMRGVVDLFFHLIKCGIGNQDKLPHTPSEDDWNELYQIAKKQTLTGIAFAGIEKLPQEQRPPKPLLLQWYSLCNIIEKENTELNEKCSAVSEKFRSEGFKNCILKGQGIAQLYPTPTLRTPGDIDIWLGGDDKKVIEYVRKFIPDCKPTYHHVDFPIAPGLDIEIHYRPSWTYNPITNRRLQKFFSTVAQEQFDNNITTAQGGFPTPTIAFNRIYILLHIYRHLFFEGIGMRQLLDYYFVMQQAMTPEEETEFIKLLKEFRLYKFAGATIYAMQEMFGYDAKASAVKPNKRLGKFLIREIMIAGNFGKYDTRYKLDNYEYTFKRSLETIKRNSTLFTRYPGETLWSPYFKVWHYFWRRRH